MESRYLIVSLHDVHPGSWAAVQRQRSDLLEWGVSQCSHLVVPRFHHAGATAMNPELCAYLKSCLQSGDELVLHGCTHDREGQKEKLSDLFWTRLYTSQEAEFLTLTPAEARERWKEGHRLFDMEKWPLHGFIAPAWLFHDSLITPMQDQGFTYTTTLREIIKLKPTLQRINTQSLCYSTRAAWRRMASLIWNQRLHKKLLHGNCIRLSLHPGDIEYPFIWQQIQNIVKETLTAGFKPTTYAAYVAR